MQQFELKGYSTPKLYNHILSDFRGVDFTNATLSIASNRSPNAINWIFKNGINQKRNGYSQFAFKSGKINGYWEFKDSDLTIHRIMQVGKRFYRVLLDDTKIEGATYVELSPYSSYKPSYYTSENWQTYLSNLRDEKSYGIVRGNRLYIFAGIFLVYGNWGNGWQLRAVRDNIDTYIPVVTTNIDYDGYTGAITRAALEDINMMTCRRRARLISPLAQDVVPFDVTNNIDTSYVRPAGENRVVIPIKVTSEEKYVGVEVSISGDHNDSYYLQYSYLDSSSYSYEEGLQDYLNQGTIKYINQYEISRQKDGDVYTYTITLYLNSDYNVVAHVSLLRSQEFTYTIDLNGIKGKNDVLYYPTIKYINGETIPSSYYSIADGKVTFTYLPHYNASHEPDIEVTYSPSTISNDYAKIDGCRFGCIFGYNSIEHLFASGNSEYPNMDWHTNESFFDYNSNIPETQNLTYWSALSYEYLGGQQSAIKSYIILTDNTLAILKEELPHENTLYLRSPYISNAVAYDGSVVRGSNGETFDKLYYTTIASAMGIGCFSTNATSNYDGDKLFLSKTGIYGIEIGDNSASSFNIQRFARRRSFLINPKLTSYSEEILKNASGITYNGKYFLALNDSEGTIYIADKVDKNDTEYTHIYEWYVWKGVHANGWFVDVDGYLGFTTDDGRVCKFNNEEQYFDRNIDLFNSLEANVDDSAIDYDESNRNFGTFKTNNSDLTKLSDYTKVKIINDNLYEVICGIGGIYYDEEIGKYRVQSRVYLDYLQYYTGETIYLYNSYNYKYPCRITNLESDDYTFDIEKEAELIGDLSEYGLMASLDEEYALVNLEEGSESFSFQLLARNGMYPSVLHFTTSSVSELDLNNTVCLVNDKPIDAKWYTPIMNMGDSNYAKTLKYFTVIPEVYLRGEIKMSFITRAKETNINVEGMDFLQSLGNVDLSTISIDPTQFARSFSKKYKIRNFNFLQILFESNNISNAALHNMSLTYVVSKRNRGVK